MDDTTLPLHLAPVQPSEVSEKRLWIGNLDTRVNEYQLLKLVRVYGNIEKFDMLFHRSGPNTGQSRGFAFVTFKSRQDAIKAMHSLNGQLLGSRKISVKFAKNTDEQDKPKPELGIAALAGAKPETKLSRKTAIQSIEAKLKMMENIQAGDDFVINRLAAHEAPIIAQYQTKQHQPPNKTAERVEQFDNWFPYDPYTLPRSGKIIWPLCIEYKDWLRDGDDETQTPRSNRHDAEDDDYLMGSPSVRLASSLSNGVSPGFKSM